jgi:hypothetical protein
LETLSTKNNPAGKFTLSKLGFDVRKTNSTITPYSAVISINTSSKFDLKNESGLEWQGCSRSGSLEGHFAFQDSRWICKDIIWNYGTISIGELKLGGGTGVERDLDWSLLHSRDNVDVDIMNIDPEARESIGGAFGGAKVWAWSMGLGYGELKVLRELVDNIRNTSRY